MDLPAFSPALFNFNGTDGAERSVAFRGSAILRVLMRGLGGARRLSGWSRARACDKSANGELQA